MLIIIFFLIRVEMIGKKELLKSIHRFWRHHPTSNLTVLSKHSGRGEIRQ
jgi:hypothetical protein